MNLFNLPTRVEMFRKPIKNSTVEGKKKKYKRAIYVIRVTNKVDGVYSMNDVSRVLYIYMLIILNSM